MPDPTPPEPFEIELKLQCKPNGLEQLKRSPLFKGDTARAKSLHSTYFDTPRLALAKAGISLRIRRDGDRLVQTIKKGRAGGGLALDRHEWETEIEALRPDFSGGLPGGVRELFDRKRIAKLRPVFEVRTDRIVAVVSREGTEIELALDSVRIDAGGERVVFAELELERKSGSSKALFGLAVELAERFPLSLSTRSKSERGYALLNPNPPRASKAQPVVLDPEQSTASAVQAIGTSCLRQLIENEAILRERPNPDGLHQARVGVRRLRAAISIAKEIVADGKVGCIRADLKWIGEQLGRARDLDVYIAKVLEPAVMASDDPDRKAVLSDFRAKRDQAYSSALESLNSERYRRAILDIAAWIECGPWTGNTRADARNVREMPVQTFARREVERRWRRARNHLKGVEQLEPEARHRVRIEIKKLRYAVEFFASVFQGTSEGRFRSAVKVLEQIQATLGDLNDIAVAEHIADSSEATTAIGDRGREAASLLKQARRQAKEFRAVEAFWAT